MTLNRHYCQTVYSIEFRTIFDSKIDKISIDTTGNGNFFSLKIHNVDDYFEFALDEFIVESISPNTSPALNKRL